MSSCLSAYIEAENGLLVQKRQFICWLFNNLGFVKLQTDEINRLNGLYKRMLSNWGVKLFEGEGKIVGPNEVEVTQLDGTKLSYSAKHILIATGGRAQRPNIPGQVNLPVLKYHCKMILLT